MSIDKLKRAARGLIDTPERSELWRSSVLQSIGEAPTPEHLSILKTLTQTDIKCGHLCQFGGLTIRELTLEKAGHSHQGHKHVFDHITLVWKGGVICQVDNEAPVTYRAPAMIQIAADKWHKFTALEDDVHYFCMFAVQEPPKDLNKYRTQSAAEEPITLADIKVRFQSKKESGCSGCMPKC
jgi:quercetin dioxygenase-like cupin family protein